MVAFANHAENSQRAARRKKVEGLKWLRFIKGTYELKNVETIQKTLGAGDVAYDVGAPTSAIFPS